ncbi:MAG: MopE-related protein, partial [Bacteroidota bacterium]
LSSPCPGSQHVYEIALCNTGNQHSIKLGQSELEVTLPTGMTYVGHTFTCQSGNADFDTPNTSLVGGHQVLSWNGSSMSGNIPEMACCVIRCTVFVQNTPPAPPPFFIQAEFNAWCTGPLQHTSTFSLSENDACSCDPNDMQVSPKGCGAGGNITFGQPLFYRIRFQNIGTGNAHDVMLRDTLDGDLDLSTLQILSSTYEITGFQLEPGNVLVIHFDGIELPPWEIGEVLFSLSPLPNLPEGTTLTNRAGIYFDANPPVITNTVLNTLLAVPAPDAAFAIARNCSTPATSFDFNYSGSTADGASFSWDFGSDAVPEFASGANPTGVVFNSAAPQEVQLTIERLGCTLSKSIWLEVLDTVPPVAICQDVSVQLDIAGQATITAAQVDDASSDNCGIAGLALSQNAFDCNPPSGGQGGVGLQTVTLTATDFDGNTGNCSASVTVEEAIFITEIEVEDESCGNFSDGSIFITAFSPCSSPQVSYSIDGGNSWNLTGEFHFLDPGSYEIVAQTSFFTATATATVQAGAAPDTWFKDMDDDSFSDGVSQTGCEQTAGFQLAANLTATSGDCNDGDALQFPGQTWFKDADNDDYSDGTTAVQCAPVSGYKAESQLIATSGDCNDVNPAVHPSAAEACNSADDNCDGEVDEGLSGLTFSGNVTFTTQAQVNAFPACYSVISGNLTFQNGGINSLSNLANLAKVTGNLTIKLTTLTNLAGLDNLDTIGGQLSIQLNSQLASLAGLENLDRVGTNMLIFSNVNLSFCCPVEHFLMPPGGVGGSITIASNKVGCKTQAQILAACPLFAPPNPPADFAGKPDGGSTLDLLDLPSVEVFPNPTSGVVNVAISGRHQSALVRIFDPQGRLVLERRLAAESAEEQFDLGGFAGGIYWVQVLVDGQSFGKRLALRSFGE